MKSIMLQIRADHCDIADAIEFDKPELETVSDAAIDANASSDQDSSKPQTRK